MYGFIIKYKDSQTDWVSDKKDAGERKLKENGNGKEKKKIQDFPGTRRSINSLSLAL